MKISPRVNDIHERFCGAMQHRYFIRAHRYEAHRICPGSATARQVLRTCVF